MMGDAAAPMDAGTSHADESALLLGALRAYRMDPGLALHRAVEAQLLRGFPLAAPVLEIGCHDGTFAALALRDRVGREDLIGGDRDDAGLVRARQAGPYGMVVRLDASRLPFRGGAFATVVCNSVLTHIEPLAESLAEMQRVLAPGGTVMASVPTPRFHRLFAPSWLLRRMRMDVLARRVETKYDRAWGQRHFLEREDWTSHLADAGLALETWQEYLGAPGAQIWSGLFCGMRLGLGRFTLGALLRRAAPAGSRRADLANAALARALLPCMGERENGSSAYFMARKQ